MTIHADTSTSVAEAALSTEFPEFPIPVVDGYTSVVTNEEFFLELEYPASDADRITAFYEEWTASEGGWAPNEPNPEVGIVGTFVADNGDTIDVLRESPYIPTLVLLSASGG